MRILGLHLGSRPAAALVHHSDLIAAVSQDRNDVPDELPWEVIRTVLDAGDTGLWEVDRVVLGSHVPPGQPRTPPPGFVPPTGSRLLARGTRWLRDMAIEETGLWTVTSSLRRDVVARRLVEGGYTGEVRSVDHYVGLSAVAWRTQPRERTLVITASSGGDGTPLTVSVGGPAGLRLLYRQSELSALRDHVRVVAEEVGLATGSPTRALSAVAAGARPPIELVRRMRNDLHFVAGGFNLAVRSAHARLTRRLAAWPPQEVAAACLLNLRRQFGHLLRHWIRETGVGHVAAAGDVFAHAGLSGALLDAEGLDSLFVFPGHGDEALAAGAAMHWGDVGPRRQGLFLGPRADDEACGRALAGSSHGRVGADVMRVAELLADGQPVARFAGREAWGPLTAGNRSVLGPADDPDALHRMCATLGLDPDRHVYPLVVAEEARRCFRDPDRGLESARLGTVALACTDWMASRCPGVVRGDGTTVPVLLDETDDPELHGIVARVRDVAGVPCVACADLGRPGLSRVRTPQQAMEAFAETRLAHLQLGPHLVSRTGAPERG